MWSGETLFLKLAGEYDKETHMYDVSTRESRLTRCLVLVCFLSPEDDDDNGREQQLQSIHDSNNITSNDSSSSNSI
jgi:hypothetical protein